VSTKEPGSCRSRIEKSRGSEACIDVANGALVTRDLEVELADMVLEAPDPVGLLCTVVAGFLFALTDKFREFLNKVSHLCWTRVRKCGTDHSDDGGGKRARVVVSPGWAVQQKLLGGGSGFGRLGCSL